MGTSQSGISALKRIATLALGVIPLMMSCYWSGDRYSIARRDNAGSCEWSPPEDAGIDYDSPSVILGRSWVTPNPLYMWPTDSISTLQMFVLRLSGERITIDDWRIEGSTDFQVNPGLDFPVENSEVRLCHLDGLSCCGFTGFDLTYTNSGAEPGEAWFVIEQSEPVRTTTRVPIIIDHDLRWMPTPPAPAWDAENVALISVDPNPVRITLLPRGEATTVPLCLDYVDQLPDIKEVRVIGEGLSISGARDPSGLPLPVTPPYGTDLPYELDIEYVSGGLPVDGLLAITFLNNIGAELTLGVPIIIC